MAVYKEKSKFDKNEDALAAYLRIIDKYEPLPNEVQLELLKKYREHGDKESYEKLIYHNLRLAFFAAKKYKDMCYSMSLLDLVQEANIAIMKSLEGYNFSSNTKLSTYMTEAISRNIQRQMDMTDAMIRKPTYLSAIQRHYIAFTNQYFAEKHVYPTKKEIMNHLNISEETYKYLIERDKFSPVSLNKKIEEEENLTELQDLIQDPEDKYGKYINYLNDKELVVSAKELLSNKEYYVIFYRLIIVPPKPLHKIAEELYVTKAEIRNIEQQALKKLRIIRKKQKEIFNKYTIKEVAEFDIKPVSPIKLSVYNHIKNCVDWLTYYFIYTQREKNYSIEDYKKEFTELTEEEIKEHLDYCSDLAKQIFTEKRMNKIYEQTVEKESISKVFKFDIEPTKKEDVDIKKYLCQKEI